MMTTQARAIRIVAVVAGFAGLLFFFNSDPRPSDHLNSQSLPVSNPKNSAASSDPSVEALPSKFRQRPPAPKISIAQTQAMLQTTIPGRVEFPEQTVLERIDAINRWINDSGIPPDELHITVEPDSAGRLLAQDLRCREFSNSNLSPRMLLGILFDVSALRYRVIPGGLEMVYTKPP